MHYLEELTERVYEVNKENGWYEEDRTFGDCIALLHSEVSEALEAYRDFHDCNSRYDGLKQVASPTAEEGGLPKPVGVDSEFADVLIRLVDSCRRYEIDLVRAVEEKLAYNTGRGYKHGGKKL